KALTPTGRAVTDGRGCRPPRAPGPAGPARAVDRDDGHVHLPRLRGDVLRNPLRGLLLPPRVARDLASDVPRGHRAGQLPGGAAGHNRRGFVVLLVMTIVLGFLFELGQVYEFTHAGFKFTSSEFTSAFFTMTGFHGGHVLGGLIILLLLLGRTLRGQFSPQHHVGVAAGTLYWHFVDLVWAFLYGVLYVGIALQL